MIQAKAKKKRTRQANRKQQAHQKVALAMVAAVVQGMLQESEKNLELDKQRYRDQVKRIWRWSNECLDGLTLGKKSVEASIALVKRSDIEVQRYIGGKGEKTVGHYAMVWLMLGYLCDDAARLYAQGRNQRAWNFLSSVVNTWTGMLLEESPADRDYEGQAGELAERVWDLVFGRLQ